MKAKLYHDKNPNLGWGAMPKFPDGFALVAELELSAIDPHDALEELFAATNHIENNWTKNPQIKKLYSLPIPHDATRQRSTSVGDVVELEDGTIWFCDKNSWKQLETS